MQTSINLRKGCALYPLKIDKDFASTMHMHAMIQITKYSNYVKDEYVVY